MAENPRERMIKQTLRKDDGRLMILYTFEPAGPAAQAPDNPKSKGDRPE